MGKATANSKIKQAVQQGCTRSSSLFNCFIKKIMNIVKAKLTRQRIGIQFRGEIISIKCFAGDIPSNNH